MYAQNAIAIYPIFGANEQHAHIFRECERSAFSAFNACILFISFNAAIWARECVSAYIWYSYTYGQMSKEARKRKWKLKYREKNSNKNEKEEGKKV